MRKLSDIGQSWPQPASAGSPAPGKYVTELLKRPAKRAALQCPTRDPRSLAWGNANRIDTSQVRAFAEIAAVAGKSQIAGIVGPTMLPGDDVLDVVCKELRMRVER